MSAKAKGKGAWAWFRDSQRPHKHVDSTDYLLSPWWIVAVGVGGAIAAGLDRQKSRDEGFQQGLQQAKPTSGETPPRGTYR